MGARVARDFRGCDAVTAAIVAAAPGGRRLRVSLPVVGVGHIHPSPHLLQHDGLLSPAQQVAILWVHGVIQSDRVERIPLCVCMCVCVCVSVFMCV